MCLCSGLAGLWWTDLITGHFDGSGSAPRTFFGGGGGRRGSGTAFLTKGNTASNAAVPWPTRSLHIRSISRTSSSWSSDGDAGMTDEEGATVARGSTVLAGCTVAWLTSVNARLGGEALEVAARFGIGRGGGRGNGHRRKNTRSGRRCATAIFCKSADSCRFFWHSAF